VESVGGSRTRTTNKTILAEIIEPRVTEIFSLVHQELVRTGLEDHLPAGVVLTGGSVILPGMPELAERVFGMPARRGSPRETGGLTDVINSPIFATGVGLVKYGMAHDTEESKSNGGSPSIYDWIRRTMQGWVKKAV